MTLKSLLLELVMRIFIFFKFGHDGEGRLEEGSKRVSPGYDEFGHTLGATSDDWLLCQPLWTRYLLLSPSLVSPTGVPGRSAVSGPESPTGLPPR